MKDITACNFYRVQQPLTKLREWGIADTILLWESELGTDHALEKLLEADIVVFQRPASEEWFNFIKLCQKNGKIIVSDYDDDPFNTSPMNPYYKFIGVRDVIYKWPNGICDDLWKNGVDGFDVERNMERQDMFRASFKRSDLVTTTTDILEKTLGEFSPKTRILPNMVDLALFEQPKMVKNEIRIGYQCGASHYEDLYLIKDKMAEICKKNSNVKFVYFGDYRFKKLLQGIPTKQIEFHGWVNNIAYPYKLALLNLDIGICPLIDNVFNRNKSSIKYVEYGAVKAATIASDIPPYSPVIKHNETGLLVKDDNWTESMQELIDNKALREKLGNNSYEDVKCNWNIDKSVHLWKDAYQEIINEEVTV